MLQLNKKLGLKKLSNSKLITHNRLVTFMSSHIEFKYVNQTEIKTFVSENNEIKIVRSVN